MSKTNPYTNLFYSSINDREIVETAIKTITEGGGGHVYDRRQPDLVLVIEVLKAVCCMAVVPNYYKYVRTLCVLFVCLFVCKRRGGWRAGHFVLLF